MVRERPPVSAVLEYVRVSLAPARHRQQRSPLIDGNAGVVRLYQTRTALSTAIELNDIRHGLHAVANESRKNPPFACGPWTEVAGACREKALRVAATLSRQHRFAKDLDVFPRRHL